MDQMRSKISEVYGNSTWTNKVGHMKDDQIVAIYYRMADRGYFNKTTKTQKTKQLSLFQEEL